jgi:hypothetical protein
LIPKPILVPSDGHGYHFGGNFAADV